jgi:NAD-dependent dihydropyrimidine dehydrogenase PreA subunit
MEPGFWYTFLYSLTILVFGLRRMHRTPTRYIRLQTWTLILVQMIPLFILPEIVLPALWKGGVIARDSWIVTNVFPIQSWNNEPSFWRSYGFILAWPLFIYNLFDSNPTLFWIILSSVQTFVIIPLIVWKWGKGAYCGWICSCGGLAETLGDEYRTEAPHGPTAKRWENIGQWILAFIFLLTAAKLMTVLFGASVPFLNLESYTSQGERFYSIAIDLIFAGVLGLGVYFFLSGRIWCRFGCPLAALMHIYARFTKYRIFADKKKCISCNICTTACHMGIDVMSYANKGIPMNDVECVRCSACIVSCPMDVLSFGELPKSDPDNRLYLELPIIQRPVEDWSRGRM